MARGTPEARSPMQLHRLHRLEAGPDAQADIFAVMNCCVAVLSVFSSDILTWSTDSLYSVQ